MAVVVAAQALVCVADAAAPQKFYASGTPGLFVQTGPPSRIIGERRVHVRGYLTFDLGRGALAVRAVLLARGFGRSGVPAGIRGSAGGGARGQPAGDR